MPERPLPPALIEQLKKNATRIAGVLGQMENADHRRAHSEVQHYSQVNTEVWGRRVRQMNISKNFPGVNVVIKRAHDATSQQIIRIIENAVEEHDYGQQNPGLLSRLLKRGLKPSYELRKPFAYAISGDLIAMAKNGQANNRRSLGITVCKTDLARAGFSKKARGRPRHYSSGC